MSRDYYVRELDEQRSKTDRSLLGKYFQASRYVSKIGYQFDPSELPNWDQEVQETVDSLLTAVVKSACRMNASSLDDNHINKIAESILTQMREQNYPLPIYQAKGIVSYKQRQAGGPDALWRRMWFTDFKHEYPYSDLLIVQLTDIKTAWTGKYYPPSGGGYVGYEGSYEYDYEPGGLNPSHYQSLYEFQTLQKNKKGQYERYPCAYRKVAYLHPSDLIQISPELEREIMS